MITLEEAILKCDESIEKKISEVDFYKWTLDYWNENEQEEKEEVQRTIKYINGSIENLKQIKKWFQELQIYRNENLTK